MNSLAERKLLGAQRATLAPVLTPQRVDANTRAFVATAFKPPAIETSKRWGR